MNAAAGRKYAAGAVIGASLFFQVPKRSPAKRSQESPIRAEQSQLSYFTKPKVYYSITIVIIGIFLIN